MSYRPRIKAILHRIVKANDKHFRFIDERTHETAYESAWLIPPGYSILHVRRQLKSLSASCGAVVELDDRGGVVLIRVITSDLPKIIRFDPADLRPDKLLIGYNRLREAVYHPLHTHVLIGGASGAGKTDCLRFMIYQLVLQKYDIRIIDMKGFSFLPFDTIPGISVARNLDEAAEMLEEVYDELAQREKAVIEHRNRDIIRSFQPIAVIIDEAAQIAPKQNSGDARKIAKLCDEYCAKIAQKGREPKVQLIYTTQRPDADVINAQVKANVEVAIAFRTKTRTNSEIIIDHGGAQQISSDTPGRCIYAGTKDIVLQVPYVGGDDEWNKLLMPMKTEVLHHGNSQRKNPSRTIYDSDSDHGATGHNVRQLESVQARIGNTLYAGKGKVGCGRTNGRHAKALEAGEEGQIYVERDVPTGEQPSSYIGDW